MLLKFTVKAAKGAQVEQIEALQKNGLIYEKDGATWYKASSFTEKYMKKDKKGRENYII